MLDLIYGVKIYFWRLGNVDFHRVHIVIRLDENIAFLQVLVYVNFDFNAVFCDATDGMLLEFVLLEQNIDDLFVGAMVDGT